MGKVTGHLYKVGDKLRITQNRYEYKIGDIVEVTELHAKENSAFDYKIERKVGDVTHIGLVAECFVELFAAKATPPAEKPPIGLRPKHIAQAQRLQEIEEAMVRYLQAHTMIPGEWLVEYHELWTELNK